MNWIDRLRLIQGERKQKDFAEWLGESPGRINNYLKGSNDYPAADFLVRVGEKGISINWLLMGRGDMFMESSLEYRMSEELQMLVKEVGDAPAAALKLTEIVRRAKETNKADQQAKSTFEGLKDALGKKPKKPHKSP